MTAFVPPDTLRARFSAALSDMYRREVPQYGALLDLVAGVNAATLAAQPALGAWLAASGELARLDGERHGAIRLGTAAELRAIAGAFAVLGLEPVGYYDLAPAGVPVHSTAFRPVTAAALAASPFRVFTSLLRHELIADPDLRAEAGAILARRAILTPEAGALADRARREGGLTDPEADRFLPALLETFRWHEAAAVARATYDRLLASHRLVADVVSFRGPHINHLTPRTLDIDAAHARMAALGFGPKDAIEGPPRRACPILLRQTSFRALVEPIRFPSRDGVAADGTHTARFGEIEQRGAALTPAGRARYDRWLAAASGAGHAAGPSPGGAERAAGRDDDDLPDDWEQLRRQGLAFFRYAPAGDPSAPMAAPAGIPPLPEDARAGSEDAGSAALEATSTDRAPTGTANPPARGAASFDSRLDRASTGAANPPARSGGSPTAATRLDALIGAGAIRATPITYEDFLPVSAAGIFRSNLGEEARGGYAEESDERAFAAALGRRPLDPFDLYAAEQTASLRATEAALGLAPGTLAPPA